MVLLMSGGHCLLGVVQSVIDFLLLGTGLDVSPGDLLDKVSSPTCSLKIMEFQLAL